MEIYRIDAKQKVLGRVATEAAAVLRGKNKISFRPHLLPDTRVEIINAAKLKLSGKKKTEKKYASYSGYPGGFKKVSLRTKVEKGGYVVPLRLAVRGMLSKNKLRDKMMARLTIKE